MTAPDLGQPSSYMALQKGAPVYSSDGEELDDAEWLASQQAAATDGAQVIDLPVADQA